MKIKKIIAMLLSVATITMWGITTYAIETVSDMIDPEAAASNVTGNTIISDDIATKQTGSDFINPEDAAENAGVETSVAETTYVTVTDSEGNPVTDAEGNVVTEVSYIEGDEENEETSVVTYEEMEGQVTYRELEDDDYAALERIKSELEKEKTSQFDGIFGTLTVIAGVLVIVYTVVVLLAFVMDKLNIIPDFEVARLVTFNHAVTLRDESDAEYVKSNKSDVYILSNKTIIINTAVGFIVGVLLFNVDKLVTLVQSAYNFFVN